MELGTCCSPADASQLVGAGLDYIEVHVQAFLKPAEDEAAFEVSRRQADACPLPLHAANCFLPESLKSVGPEHDLDAIAAYADIAFGRARQVGIDTIVFGSGGSRGVPDGFDHGKALEQFTDLLQRLAPIAAAHDIIISVEQLNSGECNFITLLSEAGPVIAQVNHPHVRLLPDFFHMLREDEPAEVIRRFGSLVHHVHLAEKAERTCPGIDGDDLRPYLKALKDIGYAGRITIEGAYPNGMLQDAPAAVAELKRQMGDVDL